MYYRLVFSLFFYFAFFSCTTNRINNSLEEVTTSESFNDNWRFSLNADTSATQPEYNDTAWRLLTVPHDWSIEGPFAENNPAGVGGGALPGGIGWYRKTFTSPDTNGKRIYLQFDGVYRNSEVWVNGQYAGKRPNGYIGFAYDITSLVKPGNENVVAVKVDNSKQPNSRWYSGSGIYRNVWLIRKSEVHIDHHGTFVTTPQVYENKAEVQVETTLKNTTGIDKEITLALEIYDREGKIQGQHEEKIKCPAGNSSKSRHNFSLDKTTLWSIENPYLYKVVTRVTYDGKLQDNTTTSFGIRSFHFDAMKGFTLNGKPLKILGVCNHHDLGALGAAINERALERQLEIMKKMGVNGIRTSHNPPAPELLDLCDRMGFLVMDEMFDMWKKSKSTYDYSNDWDEWHRKDLEDFIRRDRNHPSIIAWSVGNEIPEQWDSTGTRIAKELAGIVRMLDTTRPITTANNETQPFNHIIKSESMDLVGFNYHHQEYTGFHKNYPGKKFIATETTSALATRGRYDMPSDSIRRWPLAWDKVFTEGNPDNSVSAYDHVSAPWGSTHEETWKIMKKYPHLSGMFIWTGFDYLGEPTPYVWPSRSSYFGIVDLAGFPKDAFYMYQSEWTTTPVLHVFPHWNWGRGKIVDVWAYYNQADEVELFLNGESQGVRQKENDDLHVMWRIQYIPGVLKAISRKDGKEVLAREIRTADQPVRILLEADRAQLKADGKDLSFVTIKVLDKNGFVVPTASNSITLEVEGKGSLIATDNGDPTSHESFQSKSRKLFNGLALAIIKTDKAGGKVTVRAKAEGLESAEIILDSH